MKETQLYLPIKNYLLDRGYKVQAEVKNCDIACIYDDILVVIELKKTFNLKLLYQALDRKTFADIVYVGIVRPKNFRKKEVKHMINILKSMDIGLITVAIDSPLKTVDVVLEPIFNKKDKKSRKNKKKNIVINEITRRNVDVNIGGSSKKDKVLTSYRETSIFLACILKSVKTASPSYIKNNFGVQNAGNIFRDNYFNYFIKVKRGVYALSEDGEKMLKEKSFEKVINYYSNEVKKIV